ncbi:TetR/AcrR family transcriptional regulator C-terminal domain-containing protein [Streptomyces sp. XD-27]|uniref:TetR/AcrR family transcriptional regulator C-terminal domain-containing protein n=1 Tax=Streptomyces sp. XD-27 TaxID=3062779 RepID=UPI0026F429E5|nr:TetR/AcrR family transcriptional regulator C-terminal domain-containing protein [Streptomyces sp. XD-27]WKX71339.1 TetR/AcrR family transcriptional regulator C-terminal domain-containing protein [Streptomyces sp. XD-27]
MAEKFVPPYLRIAAELRRRITGGELAPGDRVPSTRQIAKEWNVALATATKVLTVLRQEGLVRAQPRVGTVVAAARPTGTPSVPNAQGRQGRPGTPGASTEPAHPHPHAHLPAHPSAPATDHELTRERIVRAAVGIADSEGLAALSMRGVAARLGVAAMSPYRHVNSKDDLVFLMADAVFAELSYPAASHADWRSRLELGARSLWAVHRAHPWLAHIGPLTRPLALPHLIAYSEWMLSALDGHGLDPATMLDINVLIYSYVQGTAIHLEREAQAASATGLSEDQWMDAQSAAFAALVASGAYPTFSKVIASFNEDEDAGEGGEGENEDGGDGLTGYDLRLDEVFELGLTSMLDGLATRIENR